MSDKSNRRDVFDGSWLVPLIALAVTVDQWAGATGAADAFKLFGFPVFAAARGVVLVLAVTFTLRRVRALFLRPVRNKPLIIALSGMVGVLLFAETVVVAPFVLSAVLKRDMAEMLMAFVVGDTHIGTGLLVVWSIVVSFTSTLAVAASALATFVSDAPAAQPARVAAQESVDEKPTAYICDSCGVVYGKQQSLAAHKRHCARNGHDKIIAPETIAA